jgi:hypothetical protein
MAIKGFVQLSGIPHSEYYLLNILSEKVLTSLPLIYCKKILAQKLPRKSGWEISHIFLLQKAGYT